MSIGSLKAGIYATVIADPTLSGLIVKRIYPDVIDQKRVMPYITYEVDAQATIGHMTGASGLVMTGVQFTIWAETSVSRAAVADALRLLFDGKVRQTYGTVFCQVARNRSNVDTRESPIDGSQDVIFGTFSDYDFWHNR